MNTNKENYLSWAVLVVLVVIVVYAILNVNEPGGEIIKNLTEPPVENAENQNPMEITPQPGDEKLVKKDVAVGTGAEVKVGDTVTVNYLGTLENGTKFDSSYDRGTPFSFTVGNGKVIRGWELGLLGMKVGGKRELVVPAELGYGAQANGPIPANSVLKFTIELLDTKDIGSQELNLQGVQ